ncbi:alpha/beta hydrolase [Bacillus suaedae]|uniref:Alpha/beta hydrolase n=1 Tax=Halalkalibacter suaedae TaxID=2822140 RepID=A0A940WVN5_9BACI|nr:alpha/beta hydrolase [Bacillus suaedae]MBP3952568.1 alpha/beta hydrolase [Bacillus suaedae]
MKELEIQFSTEPALFGSLTIPDGNSEGPRPTVLILSGSGPLNRDGNGKGKQRFDLYNQLAAYLTEKGFVTFRYDKRGTGKSEGRLTYTGFWDLVHDGKRAVEMLKKHECVDENQLFILGHSEGGLLAPKIGEGEQIAGFLFVASAESLQHSLEFQREQIVSGLKELAGFKGKLIRLFKIDQKAAKQGKAFDKKVEATSKDILWHQGIKIPAKWFREHYQHDFYESLREIDCPVLAVTGAKDVQSNPAKVFEMGDYLSGELDAKIIANMNHMLRDQQEEADIMKLKKVYKGAGGNPLSKEFLEVVERWLSDHVRTK